MCAGLVVGRVLPVYNALSNKTMSIPFCNLFAQYKLMITFKFLIFSPGPEPLWLRCISDQSKRQSFETRPILYCQCTGTALLPCLPVVRCGTGISVINVDDERVAEQRRDYLSY